MPWLNWRLIGRSVKDVDKVLLQQRPPHDFSRATRSIEQHRNYWKASEFRSWLLFYSIPIPPLYIHHYSLLVCALHILLQCNITAALILATKEMLLDFYKMLPELYSESFCTINAHSLSHLAECVQHWGSLCFWIREHQWYDSLQIQGCRAVTVFSRGM